MMVSNSPEDTALPLLYERDKPATCVSSFTLPSLSVDNCPVDPCLGLETQSRDRFVSEA